MPCCIQIKQIDNEILQRGSRKGPKTHSSDGTTDQHYRTHNSSPELNKPFSNQSTEWLSSTINTEFIVATLILISSDGSHSFRLKYTNMSLEDLTFQSDESDCDVGENLSAGENEDDEASYWELVHLHNNLRRFATIYHNNDVMDLQVGKVMIQLLLQFIYY